MFSIFHHEVFSLSDFASGSWGPFMERSFDPTFGSLSNAFEGAAASEYTEEIVS